VLYGFNIYVFIIFAGASGRGASHQIQSFKEESKAHIFSGSRRRVPPAGPLQRILDLPKQQLHAEFRRWARPDKSEVPGTQYSNKRLLHIYL